MKTPSNCILRQLTVFRNIPYIKIQVKKLLSVFTARHYESEILSTFASYEFTVEEGAESVECVMSGGSGDG